MAISKLADYLLQQPLYAYGENVAAQGASMAPVHSPLEGLARALTGGVGGFFAGQGLAQAKGEQKLDQTALAQAMEKYATDPTGARALLATRPNLSDTATALLTSDVGFQRQKDLLDYKDTKDLEALNRERAGMGLPALSNSPTQVAGGGQGTLAGYESGNNPQAVNPQSGAGGLYQFLPDTWAKVRAANPDLNLPETVGQANAAQQSAAEQRFRAGNATELQKAGIQPTPANLYLAHRAGAQGAQTILRASPDAPMSTVVPPSWIQQNPDMRTTVGQFVKMAQNRFPQMEPNPGTEIAQGSTAQVAPGQPQPAPQTANNVQSGDTMMVEGVPIPRAEINRVYSIQDRAERQKAMLGVVQEAIKRQTEGVPVERIRQADGSELVVPRAQAAGMTSAQNIPPPGSVEGDEDLLRRGDPRDPAYAGAFYRVANKPIEGANGQKYLPNMTAMGYRPPGGPAGQTQTAQAGQIPGSPGMTPVGQPNYNESQSKEYTYVKRLNDAIPQLEQWVKDEQGNYSSAKLPSYVQQFGAQSSMIPEMMVSDKARQYRQIVQNIITGTLRQESGASIRPEEFNTEVQKYIPQAKDSPQVIKQKLDALRTEAQAMAGGTGRPMSEFGNLSSGGAGGGVPAATDIDAELKRRGLAK